jgi:hypothetical protein
MRSVFGLEFTVATEANRERMDGTMDIVTMRHCIAFSVLNPQAFESPYPNHGLFIAFPYTEIISDAHVFVLFLFYERRQSSWRRGRWFGPVRSQGDYADHGKHDGREDS